MSNSPSKNKLLGLEDEPDEVSETMAAVDMIFILKSKELYDDIMVPYPISLGKSTSKKERERKGWKEHTKVYGEIDFQTFGIVIEKIKKLYGRPDVGSSGIKGIIQERGGLFYDLGHGTGKPVIAAAILHEFDICTGIEIVDGLYSLSLEVLASYGQKSRAKGIDTPCTMLLGNFLETKTKDWRDGDIVFANSTCYDDVIMDKLSIMARGMKKGAFFVSISRRLTCSDFVVLENELHHMSWGDATIFIMQKTTDSIGDVEPI